MKEFPQSFDEELKKGLIPFSNRGRNKGGCVECFNAEPYEEGLRVHDTIISLNADRSWGSAETLSPDATTRDITICVKDYVSEEDVVGAMIYIDGELAGTADENGELDITGIAIGGHTILITKSGYIDSDEDSLLNDYFVVV